jgi:quercetin dioxygenase-like cupin family protein
MHLAGARPKSTNITRLVGSGDRMRRTITLLCLAAAVGIGAAGALSQTPPRATQTPHQTTDLSGDPTREVMVYGNLFPPGAGNPFHSHHGDQWAVVQEGELTYLVRGEAPKTLKAGDSVYTPRGTIHRVHNATDKPARTVEIQISDKGKPRIEIVP